MNTRHQHRIASLSAALLPCLVLVGALLPASASAAPDLAMLAKVSDSGAVRDRLYTFDPASGAFNPLVTSGAQFLSLQHFAWQPDGEALAFVGTVASTSNGAAGTPQSEIWTVRRTGGGLRRITAAETIGKPAFSPDGKRLAFVARFKRRSGQGCVRGGYAVAVANVARASVRRASACFTSRLARSGVVFINGSRQIAAISDRRQVIRVAASGAQSGMTRPPVIHRAATGDRISIAGYQPGANSLWLRFDTGDAAILKIGERRSKLLPGDVFDVAPNGRRAIGNCSALPERGLCALTISTRKRTRITSPFQPDLSRDSLEFGFAFDSLSQRLVSFGFPEFGLDGLPTSTEICVRANLTSSAGCTKLPTGVTVQDAVSGIALWRPTT